MKTRRIILCCLFLFCLRGSAEQYDWVNRFGGDNSSGSSIGLDTAGNIYVAGSFYGTLTIGTNQFTSAGGQDIFLAKLTGNGAPLWAISIGGPGHDFVNRITVATNGTVFICGVLSTNAMLGTNTLPGVGKDLSGGFVARLDHGFLSWIKAFAAKSHGPAESLALSKKDQSLWVVGEEGAQILVKNYDQNGTTITSLIVGDPSFVYTTGIAVGADENIVVTGTFYESLDLVMTNLTANFEAQFTAAINISGQVVWAWVADSGYPSGGEAVALAPDGAVISAGHVQRSALGGAEYPYAFVSKHSANGTFQWMQTIGEHRGDFNATDVAVDANGYILMIGWGAGYSFDPASRWGVLLAVYDPNGRKLFEHRINSAIVTDYNGGVGIAVNAVGDAFFTGFLEGTPKFGTNVMGTGPSGIQNAFVARRPTLQPVLTGHFSGTNFTVNWPRAGVPFALQQTEDASSTNWWDVLIPPEEADQRKQVTLPAESANGFFRLRMTNELAIRHVPQTCCMVVDPSPSFLGRAAVFVSSSNSAWSPVVTITAWDTDKDALTFEWFNADTGQRLTNGTSMTLFYAGPDRDQPVYALRLDDNTLTFTQGMHIISFSVYDGAFHATNSITFEVLSLTNALDELMAAVLAATTNSEGDRLTIPLRAARDAFVAGQFDLASEQIQEFQVRLQNSTDLSDSQKTLFNSTAQTILAAISGG
jgi:hypothetical protein